MWIFEDSKKQKFWKISDGGAQLQLSVFIKASFAHSYPSYQRRKFNHKRAKTRLKSLGPV